MTIGMSWERTWGGDSHLDILTFANYPVQDGLQLFDTDLHVLGGEEIRHLPGSPFTQGFPILPPSCQALTYLPCQLAEQGFEGVIDLLFREHFLYPK